MFCVTDPDDLQSLQNLILNFELVVHWVGEHHVEEIFHVSIALFWVDVGQSHCSSVGVSCKCWHFSYQFNCYFIPDFGIEEIIRMEEGRKGSNNSHHDGHWMRATFESLVELYHFLIDHHLSHHCFLEPDQFSLRRQTPIEEQIACLHVGGVFSQLLNGVASVEQFSLLAVDVAYV